MTAIELKELLTRKPFIPKRLIMNDGATHDLLFPKTFLVTREWLELGGLDAELPPPAVRGVKSIPIANIRDIIEIVAVPALPTWGIYLAAKS